MTASLFPMLTISERAVLYLKVPRLHPLVLMIKAVWRYEWEWSNDRGNQTNWKNPVPVPLCWKTEKAILNYFSFQCSQTSERTFSLFEISKASPVCPSDNSYIKMMSTEHWWNDTEDRQVRYSEKTCPKATLSMSHRLAQDLNWRETEIYLNYIWKLSSYLTKTNSVSIIAISHAGQGNNYHLFQIHMKHTNTLSGQNEEFLVFQ